MTEISITRSAGADGTVHVAVAGEVDMQSSPVLLAALRDTIGADNTKHVDVDLANVRFLDSNGLRELVIALNLASQRGIALYVTNPRNNTRRVLEVTGLLSVLTKQAPPDTRNTT